MASHGEAPRDVDSDSERVGRIGPISVRDSGFDGLGSDSDPAEFGFGCGAFGRPGTNPSQSLLPLKRACCKISDLVAAAFAKLS